MSFEILQEWNGNLEIFSRPQAEENFRQHLLLRTDQYFTENSRSSTKVSLTDLNDVAKWQSTLL